MLSNSKLKKIFIISLIFITFIGCESDDDWIPNVRVDIRLDINTELATLGLLNSKTIPGGVNGIIIFRLEDKKFNAFDRTCPFQPSNNCSVEIKDELFAECPCCNSEFYLSFENTGGAVKKGPAKRPLKQYQTSVIGTQLHIHN
ncbi:MAG: Rieske 2Fe-2S domain-containing protein [Bacteroidales bacterium]